MKQKLFYLTLSLSLVNFLIAAFLGVLLRIHPVIQLDGFIPRFMIHAHSHVAFLGWVFPGLIAFIYKYWFSECRRVAIRYLVLLVIFQTSVLGMLFTFPFTGYALWSIVFSTIHMAASLYFVAFFERNSLPLNPGVKKFIRAGLYFMAISSMGPLALGPLITTGHKLDMWYNLAIYFYLHFQYNGWFTMVIIGLVIRQLPPFTIERKAGEIRSSFLLLLVGIILTYLLSALGYQLSHWINFVGGAGAIFQLMGLYMLLDIFRRAVKLEFNIAFRMLLGLIVVILIGKALAQLLSAFPQVVDLTYYNRDLIIAYLHWVLLGFVSLFLIYSIFREIHIAPSEKPKLFPVWLFFFAFMGMEIVLIFRALFLVQIHQQLIFYLNVFLLIDALVLLWAVFAMLWRFLYYLRKEGKMVH